MGGLRIVGGSLKGRKLSSKALGLSLKKGVLRPTSSKVREAIFNILGEKVGGSVFIDLYAGSGAVGMEAMSRGADRVYFVESDRKTAKALEDILEGCGCGAKAVIVKKKASDFIRGALDEGIKADVIFLDPPYHTGELEESLSLLSDGRLIKEGGVVIAEHLTKKTLLEEDASLALKKSYKYGDTSLTLYRVKK